MTNVRQRPEMYLALRAREGWLFVAAPLVATAIHGLRTTFLQAPNITVAGKPAPTESRSYKAACSGFLLGAAKESFAQGPRHFARL